MLSRQKEPQLYLAGINDLRPSSSLNAPVSTLVDTLLLLYPCLPHRTRTSANINGPIGGLRNHDRYTEPRPVPRTTIGAAVTSSTRL